MWGKDMRRWIIVLFMAILFGLSVVENRAIFVVAEENPTKEIVYFYSPACAVCAVWGPVLDEIDESVVTVRKYSIVTEEGFKLFEDFKLTYLVPRREGTVPLLFVGEEFFSADDFDRLRTLIESKEIEQLAAEPLKTLLDSDENILSGITGFFYVVLSGLIDGFNPCAIAMLLLFISLLGFTKDKKILIGVSISYILALFLTYFALGTVLFRFLHLLEFASLAIVLNIVILVLCSVLFVYNMYDFFVTRKNRLDLVKNQLPKGIQRWNKKIIRLFTSKMEQGSPFVYALAFGLGVIISFTEFLCTGQVYLPVIISLIQFSEHFNLGAIFYLILYNFMFVLPLIVITIAAVRSKSIMGTSEKIQRNIHWIKLANAILFLTIALYYLIRLV